VAVLAEKPSVARDIAKVLGATTRGEGYLHGNGYVGCGLLVSGEYVETDGYAVRVSDTVGAGDAFAAAFLYGLASGWPAGQIGDFANRLGALVASREGAVPWWEPEECLSLARKAIP
jgi:sugar/nucleoside kinase (ribokinase family)